MGLTVDAIPGSRLRFRLDGKLAEPKTKRWKAASEADKRLYFPILAERLLIEWRGQMLAGRGRRGKLRRPLPISRQSYRDAGEGHRGAPLLPRREESRAWRQAKVTAYADLGRVTGYFSGGFGRILAYHHTGTSGRGIPYFDDQGKLRGWRGIRGEVTGIFRDLMPTRTTIELAVSSASTRWGRLMASRTPPRDPAGNAVALSVPRRTPQTPQRPAARP